MKRPTTKNRGDGGKVTARQRARLERFGISIAQAGDGRWIATFVGEPDLQVVANTRKCVCDGAEALAIGQPSKRDLLGAERSEQLSNRLTEDEGLKLIEETLVATWQPTDTKQISESGQKFADQLSLSETLLAGPWRALAKNIANNSKKDQRLRKCIAKHDRALELVGPLPKAASGDDEAESAEASNKQPNVVHAWADARRKITVDFLQDLQQVEPRLRKCVTYTGLIEALSNWAWGYDDLLHLKPMGSKAKTASNEYARFQGQIVALLMVIDRHVAQAKRQVLRSKIERLAGKKFEEFSERKWTYKTGCKADTFKKAILTKDFAWEAALLGDILNASKFQMRTRQQQAFFGLMAWAERAVQSPEMPIEGWCLRKAEQLFQPIRAPLLADQPPRSARKSGSANGDGKR